MLDVGREAIACSRAGEQCSSSYFSIQIEFLLPIWVFVVSLHILRTSLSQRAEPATKPAADADA